jgi:hypothetical protein
VAGRAVLVVGVTGRRVGGAGEGDGLSRSLFLSQREREREREFIRTDTSRTEGQGVAH